MVHLIDKDSLVAEIERKRDDYINSLMTEQVHVLNDVLDFLDTLEVKEVDLNKETTRYLLYEHRSPLNEIMHKADLKSEMQYHKDIEKAFKAGFELGMQVSNKVQKGEEV